MESFLQGRSSIPKGDSSLLETIKPGQGFKALSVNPSPTTIQEESSDGETKPQDSRPAATVSCCGQPKVEIVSEDGVITRLVVTCSHGERIEIACEY